MNITVRYNCGTYHASVKGANCKASSTAGEKNAAIKAACKYFGASADELIVQLTGGTTNESYFSATIKSSQSPRPANTLSVDELFNKVFREQ